MSSVTAVTSQGYTAASAPQPTLSASTLLPILTSLLSSSPSLIIPLLNTHAPLTHPSVLPPNDINKFLSRLNVRVTAGAGSGEKEIIYEVARKVVEMDEEGWVVGMYGKIWVQHLYSGLNVSAFLFFLSFDFGLVLTYPSPLNIINLILPPYLVPRKRLFLSETSSRPSLSSYDSHPYLTPIPILQPRDHSPNRRQSLSITCRYSLPLRGDELFAVRHFNPVPVPASHRRRPLLPA